MSSSAGKGKGKPKGTKSTSRSSKAGLRFPVGRIARHLKERKYADRLGTGAPVYVAAVLECWSWRGRGPRQQKEPHIHLAVRNDEELNRLLGDVRILGAGVVPHIYPELLPQNRKARGKVKADIGSVSQEF